MNPIKREYSFVDLLKPENDAVVPLLLALEPGYRGHLNTVALNAVRAARKRFDAPDMPSGLSDISSASGDMATGFVAEMGAGTSASRDEVESIIGRLIKAGSKTLTDWRGADLAPAPETGPVGDIASFKDEIARVRGIAGLLFSKNGGDLRARVPSLRSALRILREDRTFSPDNETMKEYQDAAERLSGRGYKAVVFGHTHLARDIKLSTGARYLNSGTWADLMQFPEEVLDVSPAEAEQRTLEFLQNLASGNLQDWLRFNPTYVKLDVTEDGRLGAAALATFTPGLAI
jgi:hypothetical protein